MQGSRYCNNHQCFGCWKSIGGPGWTWATPRLSWATSKDPWRCKIDVKNGWKVGKTLDPWVRPNSVVVQLFFVRCFLDVTQLSQLFLSDCHWDLTQPFGIRLWNDSAMAWTHPGFFRGAEIAGRWVRLGLSEAVASSNWRICRIAKGFLFDDLWFRHHVCSWALKLRFWILVNCCGQLVGKNCW